MLTMILKITLVLFKRPYDFLYSTIEASYYNLIKLILSPLFTFFSGINNYIENQQVTQYWI